VGHHHRHGQAMRTRADFITAVAIVALIMLAMTVG
jgi:hypothetical protein